MRKRTLLIIPLILVSVGCTLLGSKQINAQSEGPTAVVTKSCINGGIICREHDPETGLVVTSTFLDGKEYVPGTDADLWICSGKILDTSNPERSKNLDCRQRIYSSELFGRTNPTYSCGNWPCSFWP